MPFANSTLFPITTGVSDDRLTLGGCAAADLAAEFGTPLYVFDEATLRQVCREFVGEFGSRYADSQVLYASKAFINPALARLVSEEGLGLDVVSGGELAVAQAAAIPPEDIYFHGNNKGPEELEMALDYGVGRIVVDNFSEMELLDGLARSRGVVQDVMLRLSPGVDPHTHVHTTTGTLDSKFGFAIETGDAEAAMRLALKADGLDLVGVHMHLGSPIFELEPYAIGIDAVLTFVASLALDGFTMREFSPGGGFAVGYLRDSPPPPIGAYAEVIVSAVERRCGDLGLGSPKLVVEPGRAIVGRAGVALYSVGSVKDIPGVRKYVSVDGGMGDNIRPCALRRGVRGGRRQPHVGPGRGDGDAGRQVLRVGRRVDTRHRDAGAGARRPDSDTGLGRLRAVDGEQLQSEPETRDRHGQRRPGSADPPPRDVPGHDALRRGRLTARCGAPSATRRP